MTELNMIQEDIKIGRPTMYIADYERQAFILCKLGATDMELADFFGVSVTTLNNWKKIYPEFLVSIKRGKKFADANVVQALYKRALGYIIEEKTLLYKNGELMHERRSEKHFPPDTTACIFWLKNRLPEQWNEKYRVEHKGEVITKIERVII